MRNVASMSVYNTMNPFVAGAWIFTVIFILIENGFCKLSPINPFNEKLETSMFPNERLTLDDCHLRYYKYGRQERDVVKSTFAVPAFPTEFAHLAVIGWTQTNGDVIWKCSGSLIWSNYILTAAHCTLDNGTAPDVVRLGDIDILSDEDDRYAQELKISEIFTHPEYQPWSIYNDIALLKLETNVTVHPTAVPACLWKYEDARLPTLEAAGLGDTGLLKASVKPVSSDECNKIYSGSNHGLGDGLKEQLQICAGDAQMGICPRDSGGPLQAKILHNGKMSPFVVGITTYGVACGSSTPGVYTRVSTYFKWISETLKIQESYDAYWSYEPMECAIRYVHLRDYEKDVVINRSGIRVDIDGDNAHIDWTELKHNVYINWEDGNPRRKNCTGTVIADDTVLTLAECTSNHGVAPTNVNFAAQKRIDIAEIHVHPEYREYTLYNNIAILKLKNRFKFSENFQPVCMWVLQNIPSRQITIAGVGRTDINSFYSRGHFSTPVPSQPNLLVRSSVNTGQNCIIPTESQSRLSHGLAKEHLCVGNPLFILPNTCQLLYGAPMQLPMFRTDRYYQYAYGLTLVGNNCGFGEAAISTQFFAHRDWMETTLLHNFRDAESSIQFINPDWKENDTCDFDYDEDISGVCTHYSKCSKVWSEFQAKRRVSFCSSASVICCPVRFIHNERRTNHTDKLDDCGAEYDAMHPTLSSLYETPRFPHVVTVWWNGSSPNNCFASLITKRMVVTAANCISQNHSNAVQVMLADTTSISVEKIIIHPTYRNSSRTDNIALLRLNQDIMPTASVFPACVWTNLTHTPFNLMLLNKGNTKTTPRQVVPMYNIDCQRDYSSRINTDQLCVDELDLNPNNTCYSPGDQLAYFKPDDDRLDETTKVTPHVVGFYSYGEECEEGIPGVFTRIAPYVNWIRENIV